MKKYFLLLAVVAAMNVAPAMSQLRFGVKVGANISTLKFNNEMFDPSNTVGFTGGAMVEYTAPMVGIGFDASLMYARKGSKIDILNVKKSTTLDYITVPINLKYKLPIPYVTPFITAGPDFSFLVGNSKGVLTDMKKKNFDLGVNLGFGLQVLKKIQVAAQYGWGLTEAIDFKTFEKGVKANNRNWTVTAAFLF